MPADLRSVGVRRRRAPQKGERVNRVFVVSSPSGGGKTTLVRELLAQVPNLTRSVSATTRAQRAGERNGADYHFVTPTTFARLRARRALLECANVHGAWYGTPAASVKAALAHGRDVIMSVDVQGARQIKHAYKRRAVLIFVMPPSFEDLKTRLINRRTDTPSDIRRRLAAARRELACARWYDYIVMNHRIPEAVEQLNAIVTAERLRVARGKRSLT